MTADPAPPPTADPLGQAASAARPSTAGAEPPEWAFIRAEVEALRRHGARRFFLTFDTSGEPTISEVRPSRRREGRAALRVEGS